MVDVQFELVGDSTPAIYEGPILYKLDSLGKLRTWRMQLDEDGRYRTLAGLADGKQAESGWTLPVAKSCPTVKEQGEFEVRAAYKHQLDREYHDSPDTVGTPKMVEPMLAKAYAGWPGPGTFDPKFDGIRMIATAAGLFSRQGQPITAVPHLHAVLGPLFEQYPDAIIDGEAYNHDLREDFGAISSIVRKKSPTAAQLEEAERVMQYYMYDLVTGAGDRWERKSQLRQMLEQANIPEGWVFVVDGERIDDEAKLKEAYARAVGDGYEGGIYAPDGYEYELGRRSKGLLKMKDFITEEFQVTEILEGNGNWAGAAKKMMLITKDRRPFGAGIRGSHSELKKLLERFGGYTNATFTATVRYFMLSPDGIPRFPVVIDYHPEGRKD